MPALLISRSMGWPFRRVASLAICPSSVTSRASIETSPLIFFSASASSGLRQQAMTCQPSAAYCRTNSRPMPRLAPVTIFRAALVVAAMTEAFVAIAIAGRKQRVVDSGRTVLHERENCPPLIGQQAVADPRHGALPGRPAMLHRHEFVQVVRVESPGIDDLAAMRIDEANRSAAREPRGLAAARRDLLHARHLHLLPRRRAVTSISMRMRGSTRPAMMAVEAGRISPK